MKSPHSCALKRCKKASVSLCPTRLTFTFNIRGPSASSPSSPLCSMYTAARHCRLRVFSYPLPVFPSSNSLQAAAATCQKPQTDPRLYAAAATAAAAAERCSRGALHAAEQHEALPVTAPLACGRGICFFSSFNLPARPPVYVHLNSRSAATKPQPHACQPHPEAAPASKPLAAPGQQQHQQQHQQELEQQHQQQEQQEQQQQQQQQQEQQQQQQQQEQEQQQQQQREQQQEQQQRLSVDLCCSNRVVLRPPSATPGGAARRQQLLVGHPWIFDFEIANIKHLSKQQTGQLLPVFNHDGRYLGSGLFSRQASIALRLLTRANATINSSSSSSSSRSSSSNFEEGVAVEELLRSRFRRALRLRGISLEEQTNSSSSNCSSSSNSSSSSRKCVWRAVDGEADGLPGVELDFYGEAAVLRLHSEAAKAHASLFISLVEKAFNPKVFCLQTLSSKKEKLAQNGAEYHSELLRGSDAESEVEVSGVSLPVHLFLPPFAAFANPLSPLLPLLRRVCRGGSLLTVDACMRGLGMSCVKRERREERRGGREEGEGLLGREEGSEGKDAEGDGAESLVMLETSEIMNAMNEKAAAANGVADAVNCIYTADACKELVSFRSSGLRFRAVYIHVYPKVRFSASERGGQFGRWFRPSLRGIESQWSAAAALVETSGLLITSLLLPVDRTNWAIQGLLEAAEKANRRASLVYSSAATPDAKLLTAQTDKWSEQVFCVQLR
ncbi:hypothetical protein Efla_002265 [Eimeria flavescens]